MAGSPVLSMGRDERKKRRWAGFLPAAVAAASIPGGGQYPPPIAPTVSRATHPMPYPPVVFPTTSGFRCLAVPPLKSPPPPDLLSASTSLFSKLGDVGISLTCYEREVELI